MNSLSELWLRLRGLPQLSFAPPLVSVILFALLAGLFFLALGHDPLPLIFEVLKGAFGDGYSLSETMVKTAPVLLCALATAVPARLGLLSVGGSGQFYGGALGGTFVVLHMTQAPALVLQPMLLLGGMAGGACFGLFAGFLRARLGVNETLVTLLLNYIGSLLVDFAVYGPWRDTANMGWPATPSFPEAARLPTFFGTRMHAGLLIGIGLAILVHVCLSGTRWGLMLRVMKGHPKVALWAGLSLPRATLLFMALGGALAGIAGICEASAVEGRLQSGIAANYGLTGFLVAWMARQHFLKIIPYALAMGALMSASDALQLYAGMPAASAIVLQVLLFLAVFVSGRLFPEGKS